MLVNANRLLRGNHSVTFCGYLASQHVIKPDITYQTGRHLIVGRHRDDLIPAETALQLALAGLPALPPYRGLSLLRRRHDGHSTPSGGGGGGGGGSGHSAPGRRRREGTAAPGGTGVVPTPAALRPAPRPAPRSAPSGTLSRGSTRALITHRVIGFTINGQWPVSRARPTGWAGAAAAAAVAARRFRQLRWGTCRR